MPSNAPSPPNPVASSRASAPTSIGIDGRNRAMLVLFAILTIGAMSQTLRNATPAVGIDYYQFWAVGRAIARHDAPDIYSPEGRVRLGSAFLAEAMRGPDSTLRTVALHRRIVDTTATPFLYTLFGAFSTANYAANLQVYRGLLLGCFAFSVVGLSRLLRQTTVNALLSLALLCLWFEPLASDLRVGNVGCLQLAGVVVYGWLRLRKKSGFRLQLAGLFMGLLVAFKPNLVLLLLLPLTDTLLHRAWKDLLRETAGLALGVGIAVGSSIVATGNSGVWYEWLIALGNVPSEVITADFGNCSPLVILGSKFGQFAKPVLLFLAVTVIALGVWLRNPKVEEPDTAAGAHDQRRVLWLLSLGCLGPVLLPHLAWLHYFVLTVPALLFALSAWTTSKALSRGAWLQYLTLLAWLGLSINPLSTLGVAFTNATYGNVIVGATVALLIATVASLHHTESPSLAQDQ